MKQIKINNKNIDKYDKLFNRENSTKRIFNIQILMNIIIQLKKMISWKIKKNNKRWATFTYSK